MRYGGHGMKEVKEKQVEVQEETSATNESAT